jgi:hypothetical protein
MSNPFEVKRFYIRESPLKPCSSLPLPSRITLKDTSISGIIKNTNMNVQGFSSKGPLSLLEIKQYLSDETTKFYVQAELAKSCDSVGMALNGLAGAKASSIPPSCSTRFTNFSDRNLRLIQQAIDNKTTAFTSQMSTGTNPFMDFNYTPQHIASKRNVNDKKELCQRYADIGQLLADFVAILKTINNNPQKTAFMDKYTELMEIYKNNGHLRAQVQNKLDNLTNSIYYQDSKEFLDSTVYVNVLWTILATTGVFYLFKSLNDS